MRERESMTMQEIVDEIEKAYPLDIFPDTTQAERDEIISRYPGFIDRTSAMMGRHLANVIREKLAGGKTSHAKAVLLADEAERILFALRQDDLPRGEYGALERAIEGVRGAAESGNAPSIRDTGEGWGPSGNRPIR